MRAASGKRGETPLAINAELDVERAREAEAEMMRRAPGSSLVLDLSMVPRFDFTGIIALVDALARLRSRFGGVSIQGLSDRIGQVFVALHAPAAEWICTNHPGQGKRKWS